MANLKGEEYRQGMGVNMSEADIAHAILKLQGSPLHFRDLFEQVMAVKPGSGKNKERIMASINTELNLDSRFIHIGKGVWALKEWMPGKKRYYVNTEDDWDN